jgi:hypothetical protein
MELKLHRMAGKVCVVLVEQTLPVMIAVLLNLEWGNKVQRLLHVLAA